MATFDELFDEFMKNFDDEDKQEKLTPSQIFEMIGFPMVDVSKDLEAFFDDSLGEPDNITFIEKDGLFYEKQEWIRNGNSFSKHFVHDKKPYGMLTLEEKLDRAIETEDYEEASRLRDEIKKLK